jgi:hypothetical protein
MTMPKRSRQTDSQEDRIVALHDAGLSSTEIAKELGVGARAVRHILEDEKIRREAAAAPPIDPSALSLGAQKKLDLAIEQHRRKLVREFEQRVQDECKARVEATILPAYNEERADYRAIIKARKGLMDRATYRKILSCLRPDRVSDPAFKGKYEEAFRLFTEMEKLLLDEKENPTSFWKMPNTYAEMMELKRQATERRKARANASIRVR